MSRKTYRCYLSCEGFTHTKTGKRAIYRTDAIPTHCCSFSVSFFVWEKSTKYNHYEGYSGYFAPSCITFIDLPRNMTKEELLLYGAKIIDK